VISNLILTTKRKIISSSFFWKVRHFFQPSWIDAYDEKVIPKFYFDFLIENNISSVLDFGCATGKLLYDLNKENHDLISYGIDINDKAVNACNQKFNILKNSDATFFFDNKVNVNNLNQFLNINNLKKFDLIVFDRVLYCLNEDVILNLMKTFEGLTNFILIEDFQTSSDVETNGYMHRDWAPLLKKFNFKNIVNIPTIYQKVNKANARTLVFKKLDI
jgi:SAM-dependent methyltransferase